MCVLAYQPSGRNFGKGESAGTRKVGGYRKGVEDERLAWSLFQPRIRLEKGIKPCSQTEPLLFTIRRVRC